MSEEDSVVENDTIEVGSQRNDQRSGQRISLLMFTGRWQVDTCVIAALTRSLVNDLRLTDPEANKIDITCAVLEEDGKINPKDLDNARKHNVRLRGARRPKHDAETPNIKWFDRESLLYYHHLILERQYDFIIGHMPYVENGAFHLQQLSHEFHDHSPKVILVVHALPETPYGDVDRDYLIDCLRDADMVLSVGHGVEAEVQPHIADIDDTEPPIHKVYVPYFPLELLRIKPIERELKGKQVITLMIGDKRDLDAAGLDYELAMAAAVRAADDIVANEGFNPRNQIRMEFMVVAPNDEERVAWGCAFKEMKGQQPTKFKDITFSFAISRNQDDLKWFLRQSAILLLPLKAGSPLFGIEALSAAAAGTPILVSRNAGIASLLQALDESVPVAYDTNDHGSDAMLWSVRIIHKLKDSDKTNEETRSIRRKLIQDTTIAASHLDFIQAITESANVHLRIDLGTNCNVTTVGVDAAIMFGVDLGDDKQKPNLFVVAFLTKLLHQREKIDLRLLDAQLSDAIRLSWKQVLALLEERGRRLGGVRIGSVMLSLFCPLQKSRDQLHEEPWLEALHLALTDLLDKIGVRRIELSIRRVNEETRVDDLEFLQPLHYNVQRHYLPPSDSGYDEASSVISSQMNMLLPGNKVQTNKVKQWLSAAAEDRYVLERIGRWDLDHLPAREDSHATFAVGQHGSLGIACKVPKANQGSLSVLFPNPDTPPVTLSPQSTKYFFSPIFIQLQGREYLAVYNNYDKNICLWDVKENSSHIVFKFQKGWSEWLRPPKEPMNLCVIDENTVAGAEVNPSSDGTHKVYILDTSVEQWYLRNTSSLATGVGLIWDICYLKTHGGTQCLVLSCPYDSRVQAMDMASGRNEWQTDSDQTGPEFVPYAICPHDADNVLFVADAECGKIHVLSSEHGTLLSNIHLSQHDVVYPYCVRIHDDYVYLAHRCHDPRRNEQWQITKFAIAQ